MDNMTAQKVVTLTLAQIRGDYQAHGDVGAETNAAIEALDRFQLRLADNLKLAGIAQPGGRKLKAAKPKPVDGKKD
jgi:hypothetical protein